MGFYEFNIPTSEFLNMFLDEKDFEERQRLQAYYDLLNHEGKQEAIKRVSELTEIKKYTDPDEDTKADPDHKE